MRDKIIGMVRDALESKDHSMTWFYDLVVKDGKRWAFVVAWMDWDGNGEWNLYGKVAYQPINSIMQCDYDIDWRYPMTEDGECDDNEVTLAYENSESVSRAEIDYLLEEWERIEKEYVK